MDLTITATIFLEIVKGVVKSSSSAPRDDNHSVAQLISALGDVSTAVQNIDLLTLCKTINNELPVKQYFNEPSSQQNEWRDWRSALKNTQFLEDFERFLQKYGFRGPQELEVRGIRWHEKPEIVISMIHSLYMNGCDNQS